MDVKVEIIKEEVQFEDSTVCIKAENADEDVSTYGVYQNNIIPGNNIKEESDDEDMWDSNVDTKKQEVVLEAKEESSSDKMHDGSLSKIKTEELMLKSESEVDDSETGSARDLKESNDDEDEMWERNINTKEKKVVLEIKEESKSEDSLPEIKTEELMLKSESEGDSSKTGSQDIKKATKRKSRAEYRKKYRERKKSLRPARPPPKTCRERAKAYRERKKFNKISCSQSPSTSGEQNLILPKQSNNQLHSISFTSECNFLAPRTSPAYVNIESGASSSRQSQLEQIEIDGFDNGKTHVAPFTPADAHSERIQVEAEVYCQGNPHRIALSPGELLAINPQEQSSRTHLNIAERTNLLRQSQLDKIDIVGADHGNINIATFPPGGADAEIVQVAADVYCQGNPHRIALSPGELLAIQPQQQTSRRVSIISRTNLLRQDFEILQDQLTENDNLSADSINELNFHSQETLEDIIVPAINTETPMDISNDEELVDLPYSTYTLHRRAHADFRKKFTNNQFGFECMVCDRLWFEKDLKIVNEQNKEILRQILIFWEEVRVCSTCSTAIKKGNIPFLAVFNGFKYPDVPCNLPNLDLISERLISPRLPFMQIRRLRHVQGQYGIYGQVINVPVSVNTMVNTLPRDVDDDYCINVHIKRKLIHKSSYLHGLVKKSVIKSWLRYLVNTPLYKFYDIKIDNRFLNDNDSQEHLNLEDVSENIEIEESLVAQQQTLLWNDDLQLRIAPGENKTPESLLFDEHAEELSFPAIYIGEFRKFRDNVKATPFNMASSELRRRDRRGVTPYHLLFVAMKIMRLRIRDSLTIAFKHVGRDTAITREQIMNQEYIDRCLETNLAFTRCLPNSAAYWAERKKCLFAMIRQLGRPTAFMTLSANEIGWEELLRTLYKLKHQGEILTDNQIWALHYLEKTTLVNEDPVTCVIYFHKLVNVIMSILQSKTFSPFGKYKVKFYFKRIEFQHRGSAHAHFLLWLENTADDVIGKDKAAAIFMIDALISVSVSESSANIKLQRHKHTFTCYKRITSRYRQKCRFDAPFMPSRTTVILTPMEKENSNLKDYQVHYNEIRNNLENEDFSDIDDFYRKNHINSDEHYNDILRAGITRPRIFVKRSPTEKWHNPFNPFVFNILKSNMDFQIITEEYSCAQYVADYVNKTNRGISNLQRQILEIMDEHPEFDIVQVTHKLGVSLLNTVEMTSQEAAWFLLREPMSECSVFVVYIPTCWPQERERIRKSQKELEELDAESTDIWKENWFDKYQKRPASLESTTLAQFVAKYNMTKNGNVTTRRVRRVIRYTNYDIADLINYKREMVTLHMPFRNESVEVLAENKFLNIYDDNEDTICQRRKEFEKNLDIEKTIELCRRLCREDDISDETNEQRNNVNAPIDQDPFQQIMNNPNATANLDLALQV